MEIGDKGGQIQQPAVMQGPLRHQGVVNTKQHQPPKLKNPEGDTHNNSNGDIYMVGEDILLQTRNRNYEALPDIKSSSSSISLPITPLNIPPVPIKPMPKMVKCPMRFT